ncbi:unnamed protein product [Prorocentrum cordatum]|uniref:Uncharacterized protein n=1 Tax=Prorocentrum cordatum TaxID=2364126 RepID=A0ABN9WV88_9DINO|nr:unnamed protein product [Polarella glacialis]
MSVALVSLQLMLVWGVVQFASACYIVARSFPGESIRDSCKSAARRGRSAIASVREHLLQPSERDPMEKKIRQMMVMSRLEVCTNMLPLALFLNTLLLLNVLRRRRLWTVSAWFWYEVPSDVDLAQLRSECFLVMFRHLITLLFCTCPQLRNPTFIRFGFAMVYVRLAIEATVQNGIGFATWVASTAPVRLGASVMLGELATSTYLNVLLSALCYSCHAADWHASFHMYLCAAIWSTIYGIDCARYAQFRAVLEARKSQSVEAAADGLLSQLCDAVVHLGEDLRITQPSPQLAGILLRPCCSGLKTADFLDFFTCGAESERARGFLLRDAPGAAMLHTSLRDSVDAAVPVQLFHVCGQDFDDQIFHVVGVREDAESFRVPPDSRSQHDSLVLAPPAEHTPSDAESVRTLQLEDHRGDLVVYFRLFEAGYPVESCSAGFTLLSGPSTHGTRLLEWVVSTESFLQCVRELGGSVLRTGPVACPRRSVRVRLRPPHLHRLGEELSAEAVLSVLHSGSDADAEPWTAMMELRDTKVVRYRTRSERGQIRPPSKTASVESIEESSDEVDVLEDMDVYIKVLEDGYPVTECSRHFASLVGLPEVEIRLLDLLVDAETFITQAQIVCNSAFRGDFTATWECQSVYLKRPRKGTSHRSSRLRATVKLSVDHNSAALDISEWTVRVKLHDVTKAPRRARTEGPRTGGPPALQASAREGHPDGVGPSGSLRRRQPGTAPAGDHGQRPASPGPAAPLTGS